MSKLRNKVKKNKKSKFVTEFKAFLLKGNVIDLAVGVIIGGAFQKIVSSLVDDLVMPLMGLILGKLDFSKRTIDLPDLEGNPIITIKYGSFITNVTNFVIMGFVIFLLVKGINKLREIRIDKKAEEPTTKKCQFCCSEINVKATRCPHCTSGLDDPSDE